MIESRRWLMVNISACLPLIGITVNDNSLLRLKTARPIREQKIAMICGNEEKLVKPGDMNARSRWANMRSVVSPKKLLNKYSRINTDLGRQRAYVMPLQYDKAISTSSCIVP